VDDLKKIISVYSITKKMSTKALYLLEDHESLRSDIILLLCQYITALGAVKGGIEHMYDNMDDDKLQLALYLMTKESVTHAAHIEKDLHERGIVLEDQ
jgi:hypothetical protein